MTSPPAPTSIDRSGPPDYGHLFVQVGVTDDCIPIEMCTTCAYQRISLGNEPPCPEEGWSVGDIANSTSWQWSAWRRGMAGISGYAASKVMAKTRALSALETLRCSATALSTSDRPEGT